MAAPLSVEMLLHAFAGSMSPDQGTREQAETVMHTASQMPGFYVLMLQLVTNAEVEEGVRQAAVIFLKNFSNRSWEVRKSLPEQYVVPEADKEAARANIVECMVSAAPQIRKQLMMVIKSMLDEDFPAKFAGFDQKIVKCTSSSDPNMLTGGIMVLYQVTKHYRWSQLADRVAYDSILAVALPELGKHAATCVGDGSAVAMDILRQILKLYYGAMNYEMPPYMCEPASYEAWLTVFAQMVSMKVETPPDADKEDWPRRPVWKAKKWACRILFKLFERYGTPSQAEGQYRLFAEVYATKYSAAVLELMWNELVAYREGTYIAPKVISGVLKYFQNALEPAQTWKMMLPLVPEITATIIFPMMCFSDEDAELWETDPREYIQRQFDPAFAVECGLPAYEAAILLAEFMRIRPKHCMQHLFEFTYAQLQADAAATPEARNPRNKDGALHMVAVIGVGLLKRKKYKNMLEQLLVQFVLPEFASPHGHLRARACNVLYTFSMVTYQDFSNVQTIMEAVLKCLQDEELPVRCQAAIALRKLLEEQSLAQQVAKPFVKEIVTILLTVLKDSESDDLAAVLDVMIELFPEELQPYSVQLLEALLGQFKALVGFDSTDESQTNRAMACMACLQTVQTVTELCTKDEALRGPFEQVLQPVMASVLQEGVLDFVDEILVIMTMLTDGLTISAGMWQLFGLLYQAFKTELLDYYVEMCPVLWNFMSKGMTVPGTYPAEAPQMIFDMCKTVWELEDRDDECWHAGRMIENAITWCAGHIDELVPGFVGLAIQKLGSGTIKTDVLTIMSINIVLTALQYNPGLVITAMEAAPVAGDEPVLARFFALWFTAIQERKFTGVHNRKLGILTLCTLLELDFAMLPPYIQQVIPHAIEMSLILFEKLPRAYDLRNLNDADSDDEHYEDEEIDDDADGLDDEADFADPLDDDQLRAELRGMGVKATTTLLRISHAFPISQLYATPLCTIST